jgi:hypothetical protein
MRFGGMPFNPPPVAVFPGSLSVNGDVTLGDASGDEVVINAGSLVASNANIVENDNSIVNVAALDERYGGQNWTVFLSSNADLTEENTVLEDVIGLSIEDVPSGEYYIKAGIAFNNASDSGSKASIVSSGGESSGSLLFLKSYDGSNNIRYSSITATLNGSEPSVLDASHLEPINIHVIDGIIQLTGTRTLKVQAAQQSSSEDTTSILEKSYLTIRSI